MNSRPNIKLIFQLKYLLFALCCLNIEHSCWAEVEKHPQKKQVLRVWAANSAAETGVIRKLVAHYQSLYPQVLVKLNKSGGLAVLDRGRNGEADVIITHYAPGENLFVSDGFGVFKVTFMFNEFIITGPANDPANVKSTKTPAEALNKIAKTEADMMVPNIRSGTYKKLNEIWTTLKIRPDWVGYENTGASSKYSLLESANNNTYAFVDLGTYLSQRKTINNRIVPLFRDHQSLRNYYSAIVVNNKKVTNANTTLARHFVNYLAHDDTQELISQYGIKQFGVQIYTPAVHLDPFIKNIRAQQQLKNSQQVLLVVVIAVVVFCVSFFLLTILSLKNQKLAKIFRRSEQRFKLAVEGTHDGIWDWNIKSNKMYFSKRVYEILNIENNKRTKATIDHLFQNAQPNEVDNIKAKLENYIQSNSDEYFSVEFRIQKTETKIVWVLLRGKAIRNKKGVAIRITGALSDISDRIEHYTWKYRALHDSLTRLPNRILFNERIEQTLQVAQRNKQIFSLLMIDINDFKSINDTLGHQAGDYVLQWTARKIVETLREVDTVCRLGGDEFVVILPGSDYDNSVKISQKLFNAMDEPIQFENAKLNTNASIGIATYPVDGNSSSELLKRADVTMYQAKNLKTMTRFDLSK